MKRLKFIIADHEEDMSKALSACQGFLDFVRNIGWGKDVDPVLVEEVTLCDLKPQERFYYKDGEYRVLRQEGYNAFTISSTGVELKIPNYEVVQKIWMEGTLYEKEDQN